MSIWLLILITELYWKITLGNSFISCFVYIHFYYLSFSTDYIFCLILYYILIKNSSSSLLLTRNIIASLYAASAMGPVIGFALGAFLLQYPADVLTMYRPFKIGPGDPEWIGAWWAGFILLG